MNISPKKNELVLNDPHRRQWLHFRRPQLVLQTSQRNEVMPLLHEVQTRTRADALYAAGFVAYEAAPAFDAALTVRDAGEFPLLWFGLYAQPEVVNPFTLPYDGEGAEKEFLQAWQPSISRDAYHEAIGKIKEQIAAGQTYQVNYTLRMRTKLDAAASSKDGLWHYFLQLVRAQKPPLGAYVNLERYAICCASPELFFRLEDGRLTARPMKGTAPRGLTWEQDRAQAAWLHDSEKNRSENVMIVDMIRNDMGRVAEFGSVEAPQLFTVEKYPSVWQMTSTVTARTKRSAPEILQALFPCASITGAPKRSTMQMIAELEQGPRRIYTGSIGYITPSGNAQFNVAIRTVLLDRETRTAEYGVGGGIVWDSTAEGEWEECATKTRILMQKRPPFRLLETLLWQRTDGYSLLDNHLKRLARSADYFDYALDLEAICNQLQKTARGFTAEAYRLRLLVADDGAFTVESAILEREREPLTRRVCLAPIPVDHNNPFLYHKTTNRGIYEKALDACPGFDDVLLWNGRGEVTESCLANVVVELDGERVTPPVESGLLAGTYREWLLQQGLVRERVMYRQELQHCTGLWLVNSVRGEMRAQLESAPAELAPADAN